MSKSIIKLSSFVLLLVLMSVQVFAQENDFFEYKIAPKIGVMNYYGDLTDDYPRIKNYAKLAYGLHFERALSKALALRLSGTMGKITYDDRTLDGSDNLITDNPNLERGLNFETDIFDTSAELILGSNKGGFISPYLTAGFGLTFFDVYGDPDRDGEFDLDLQEEQIEGEDYGSMTFHVPIGLGLRFQFGDRVGLNLETNFKYTFTDYLDDVKERGDAGDPDATNLNDIYNFSSVALTYNFGPKKKAFKAPVLIADKYSTLTTEDIEDRLKKATEPTTTEGVAATVEGTEDGVKPMTRKERRKARKEGKVNKDDAKRLKKEAKKEAKKLKKNIKSAIKACKAACEELEDRSARKKCRKACKQEENYSPYLVQTEAIELPSDPNAPVAEEEKQYQEQLDSLQNVIQTEQEQRQEGKPVAPAAPVVVTPPAPAPAPAPIIVQPPAPAPAPVAPAAPSINEGDIRSIVNERDVQDLKLQMEILKLKQEQQKQQPIPQAAPKADPTTEMYKLEVERLRQESMERKIIGEIEKLRLEMNNRPATIEKEVIIEKEEKEDKKKSKEDKKYEETIEKLNKQLEELQEDMRDMQKQNLSAPPPPPPPAPSNISNDELMREIERLRKELDDAKEEGRRKRMQKEIDELRATLNNKNNDRGPAPSGPSNQALLEEIAQLKAQIAAKQQPIIQKNDNTELKREVAQLREELKKKDADNDAAINRKIDGLNKTIGDLHNKLAEVNKPIVVTPPPPPPAPRIVETPPPPPVVVPAAPIVETIPAPAPRRIINTTVAPAATPSLYTGNRVANSGVVRPYPWEIYYQNASPGSILTTPITAPTIIRNTPTPRRIVNTTPIITNTISEPVRIVETAPTPSPAPRIVETEPIIRTRVIRAEEPSIREIEVKSYDDIARYVKATLYFDSNSTHIKASEAEKLGDIVTILNEYPQAKLSIEGHADKVGTAQQNNRISEKRALSVQNKLINDYGVDISRLLISFYGFQFAKTAGANPLYRKVDLNFLK